MLFAAVGDEGLEPEPLEVPGHVGFVAGRYRNWTYSDLWTDVRRCAERTFTAYLPAYTCGWVGTPMAADEVGYLRCHRAVRSAHLATLLRRAGLPAPGRGRG